MEISSAKRGKSVRESKKTIKLDVTSRKKEILAKVFDQYAEDLYRFCMRRLYAHEQAEDVVSAVFLDLTKEVDRFHGQPEQAIGWWLFAAARNKVNAHLRKTIRRKEIFRDVIEERKDDCFVNPPGEEYRQLEWPVLLEALGKLNPRYRDLILMRFFDNFEPKEMAEILDAKPGSIRVTLNRAMNQLRKHLQVPFGERS